ncbi:HU family DNA-binding protein [Porphyromonas circumdentaria]|uniref:DNA-binding protein, histone-like, putative n=1 Tax=Porphyromonas circumdentaria TaxID=29524 RepID=A0A1T4PC74_9PORP|nr:HU family DNA-binding protein [Porphyromonas circumdentaria]MBB6276379.1 putative histone-like DNA-binding protein [Porphyromonas circumdentaria]MDO4722875.1 DNA-binding protein [Porphyromonas circumdentaria]SJZ89153.1 DNA-binding protein, histone-like, putative [Porphyromonas circumdentaria]
MALKFKLIEREMKIGKKAGHKLFFAQQVTQGRISFDKLCNIIAESSTVSSADVKAVIDRLAHVFGQFLTEGFIIDCGELGSFRPTLGSQGVEKEEEFKTHKHLRKPRIRYLAPRSFNALTLAGFQRIDKNPNKPDGNGTAPLPPSPGGSVPPPPAQGGEESGEGI